MDNISCDFEKTFLNLCLTAVYCILIFVLIFLNVRVFRKFKGGKIFSMIFEFNVVKK